MKIGNTPNSLVLDSDVKNLGKFRHSAKKSTIKAVILQVQPFVFMRKDLLYPTKLKCLVGLLCWARATREYRHNSTRVPTCCVGFAIELIMMIQEKLNFDLYIYEAEENQYGAKIDGVWSGMVGQVVKGKADMVLAHLTVLQSRSKVVDFTYPFYRGKVSIATITYDSELPYINIEAFKPLSSHVWLITLVMVVLSCNLLFIAELAIFGGRNSYTISNSIIYVFGLMFQRDLGARNPCYVGSRFMAIATAMSMITIMSTYTAVLTTRNIESKSHLPIDGASDPKVL